MLESRSRKIKAINVTTVTMPDGKIEYEIYLGTHASEIYVYRLKNIYDEESS